MSVFRSLAAKKFWLAAGVTALLALVAFGTWRYMSLPRQQVMPTSQKPAQTKTAAAPAVPRLRFAAMGDMLAHDTVVQQAKKGDSYDFTSFFSDITPLYKDADVVFCNPETLAAGSALGISGYPTFNAPTEFARDLVKGARCNLINLASNHINDRGQAGIDANLAVWDSQPVLAYAGSNRTAAEQHTVKYFERNGLKVAFLAFADYSNMGTSNTYGLNNYHDQALVTSLMTEARRQADAVVVSMHWGTEDSTAVNNDQRSATQRLADLGADVVIGTGPHVLQQAAYVTGANGHRTLAWYSIGNVLSSQLKVDELTGGVAGFTLTKEKQGVKISDVSFKATYMSYDWSAADRASQNLLARHNLLLQPLASADANVQKMFGSSYTAATRAQFIRSTLTADAVTVFEP